MNIVSKAMMKRHSFINRKANKGLTLAELVITMAVAAILFAVAIPSFTTMIQNNRITTQTNDIIAAISFARSEAVKRNSGVTFCRVASDTATSCANGDATDNWTNWIVLSGTDVIRRGTINTHSNSLIIRSTLTNNSMFLSADGLSYTGGSLASGQQITACSTNTSTNNQKTITIGAGNRLSTTTESGTCS